MASARKPRFTRTLEVFRGADFQWYFRAKAANYEPVYCGEGYPTKQIAVRAANREAALYKDGIATVKIIDPETNQKPSGFKNVPLK